VKTVSIFEKRTKKVVAEYAIDLHGLNHRAAAGEYYDEAWRRAVADGAVQAGSRDLFDFRFED
jgi:hypothetical protein